MVRLRRATGLGKAARCLVKTKASACLVREPGSHPVEVAGHEARQLGIFGLAAGLRLEKEVVCLGEKELGHSTVAAGSKGVLLLHHHNGFANRAQAVSVKAKKFGG